MKKRFISAVMSVLLVFSSSASVFAENSETVPETFVATEVATDATSKVESELVTEVMTDPTEVVSEISSEVTDISTESTEETEASTEEETEPTEEPEPNIPYIYNNQMSVFDIIAIKRSLMANDGNYNEFDYEYVRDSLIRRRSKNVKYAKTVVIQYDKAGYSSDAYSDASVIDSKIGYVGDKISIPQHSLIKESASQGGWMYDGKNYIQGEKFTIPDVDRVVFTPYWFIYHTITYYAGDYDDVVEYPSFSIKATEGLGIELADTTRFTRPGYKLIGWKCDYDGLSYGPLVRYTMPETDVVFTAIWEPTPITVSISANNGVSTDKIIDTVYANEQYVLPECTFTNGDKTFLGWRYNKIVYQPGDIITIPALLPGLSVIITAKWG